MKILISIMLIIIMNITGIAFAIEKAPEEVALDTVTTSEVTENQDQPINVNILLNEDVDSEQVELIKNQIRDNIDFKEITGSFKSLEEGFTSSIFKIIVLAVAIIVIMLLLLALSKKKNTSYSPDKKSKKNVNIDKTKVKEIQKEENSKTSNIVEDEIVIPSKEEDNSLEETPNYNIDKTKEDELKDVINLDDLILNLEDNNDSVKNGLAEELSNDIELILENTDKDNDNIKFEVEKKFEEIDDIDQLNKAIKDKEKELEKLENEVLEEKKEEVTEKRPKVKDVNKSTKKDKVKKEKKAEVTEIEEEKLESLETTKKEKVGLAEDFLTNMEKTMKEDNKK